MVHLAIRLRGEALLLLANQKQELTVAGMFVSGSGRNEQYLERTFHGCSFPSLGSFGHAVSEGNIF
jgi:hypothetical protein